MSAVRLSHASAFPWLDRPSWFAYDPNDAAFYVAVSPSSVYVVPYSATSLVVSAVIAVGTHPFAAAVDPTLGEVFVTNSGSDNVSVISDATNTVVATIAVGADPQGIAFDPVTGVMYVADGGSSNVSVVNCSARSVLTSVDVGTGPVGVAYDNLSARWFVADRQANEVTVVSAADNDPIATVPVGSRPYGVAVDNATDAVYVTNENSSNVSVLSAATAEVVASVPVVFPYAGSPNSTLEGIAYDPADGLVWAGAGSFFTVVISPATESVVDFSDIDPAGVAYDPDSGAVCVSDTANVTFDCFLTTAGWDPAKVLTFTETGLPAGALWTAQGETTASGEGNVTGSSRGPSISFGFDVPYGVDILRYSIGPADRYLPDPASGVVNSSALPAVVDVNYVYSPGAYAVDFEESGLPQGTSWSVDLGGTILHATTAEIEFSEPSGTYGFRVAAVAGYHVPQRTAWGTVEVDLGSVVVPAMSFTPSVYTVTFTETGLPRGSEWSVSLLGTTSSDQPSLFVSAPNGSYAYSIGAVSGHLSPPGGTVVVAGENQTVPVSFVSAFAVTFGEAGLASGTSWAVTLAGVTVNSTSDEIQFVEPNSTYPYSVSGATGYSANPGAGTVVVAGLPVSQGITFTPLPTGEYPVKFTETGLAAGIGWSVEVSNATLEVDQTLGAVSPAPIVFYLLNGSYSWGVFVPAGYSSEVPAGPVVVHGSTTTTTPLSFRSAAAPGAPSVSGPLIEGLVLTGVSAVLVGTAIGWMLRRDRRPPAPPRSSTEGTA
ncbi:MAG TPA: YncE family protein [Thermoplasmata archaeon]|nr:YncE family protein [Thermoplasmata archaeon]